MKNSRQPVSLIATDNPDEARTFFADVLRLELRQVTPFGLVFVDGGHVLRVQIVSELQPVGYTVHGWQVANIAHDIEELTSKGMRFQRFDQLTQDELGVWTTPDGNKVAWFSDPSGNTLSLTEYGVAMVFVFRAIPVRYALATFLTRITVPTFLFMPNTGERPILAVYGSAIMMCLALAAWEHCRTK